jgi:hypothetical protein
MRSPELSRFALSIGVAAAMLTGCGGSQPPIGLPSLLQNSSQGSGIAKPSPVTPTYKVSAPLPF